MNFLKNILDICLLRGRVQDLPTSTQLLVVTGFASVVVNTLSMPEQNLGIAQLLFVALQPVLFGAVIFALLRLRGFPERWVQTMTALYAVDAVFSLLKLPFLPAMLEMMKQGPEAQFRWEAVLLLFLGGWLLLITARILREATEWPLPLAFFASLTALLVVFMLSYLLMPLFGFSAQT